jgi:hypothetical protein
MFDDLGKRGICGIMEKTRSKNKEEEKIEKL